MTRFELARVEKIINLWLSYEVKRAEQDGVIGEGPGLSEARIPSTKEKPDIMAKKAERLEQYEITPEEQQAKKMIYTIPYFARNYLTVWPQFKNKINPETRQRYSLTDVAAALGRSLEDFKMIRDQARLLLIKIDRRFNKHLYQKAA